MDENLKIRAEEIRDEIKVGRNTASRVGSFLLDLLKYISDGIPFAKSAKADAKGNVIDEIYMTKEEFNTTPIESMAYKDAKANGYAGTKEEFYNNLSHIRNIDLIRTVNWGGFERNFFPNLYLVLKDGVTVGTLRVVMISETRIAQYLESNHTLNADGTISETCSDKINVLVRTGVYPKILIDYKWGKWGYSTTEVL